MHKLFAFIAVGGCLLAATGARADEINLLASNGIKAAFLDIAPQFEKATGHRVNVMWDASNLLFKKIEDGQAFDAVIISPDLVAKLVKSGKVAENSTATLVRVGLGVAVKEGAPKPDISSVDAFKQTLLNAKGIAYTTSGLSGVQFMRIADQLGIADQVKAKGKTVPAGASAEFVAKGEADVAVQLIPELASVKGVQVVGPFPKEVQTYIVLTGGIAANSGKRQAVEALLKYLASPEAITVIKSKGMEPG